MADTEATCDVLMAQLERYDELENTTSFLSEFSSHKRSVDVAGFIVYNDKDEPTFSFGKHKGKTVDEVLEKEPGYFGWLLNADFPLHQKVLTAHRLNKLNNASNEIICIGRKMLITLRNWRMRSQKILLYF